MTPAKLFPYSIPSILMASDSGWEPHFSRKMVIFIQYKRALSE